MTITSKTLPKFMKFLIVGGLAFFIDGGLLQFLVGVLEMSPYLARCFSFTSSVIFTWYFNRTFTFKVEEEPSIKEFITYISSQAVGLFINFSIYSLCIAFIEFTQSYPILALIPATAISLIFNYFSMKKVVFKTS